MKFLIFKIFIVMTLICLYKADLPVHCRKSQIIGKWTFHVTQPKERKIQELYDLKCGHQLPSDEKTSYLSLSYTSVENFDQSFEAEFTTDEVISNGKVNINFNIQRGFWTMIYNEGFEFRFNSENENHEKYFAFSKYGPNSEKTTYSSNWVSYCHETLIGWYNIGNKWGCFYGSKNVANPDEITNGEPGNKQKITEDSIIFIEKNNKNDSFLSISKYSRFAETSNSEELVLDANFKDHSKLVERINSANLTWKAKNYKEFEGYSRGQLKKMIGTLKINKNINKKKKFKKRIGKKLSNKNQKDNSNKINCPVLNNKNNIKLEDLPENFNWDEFMTSPRSQGSCGSCYAMATISMLEARFRIHECEKLLNLYKDKGESNMGLKVLENFEISLDHVLKCSIYNQACDGGYSVLVSKFFNEFELYPNECFDKDSDQCHQTKCKEEGLYKNFKFTIKDYYYTGGSYGKTDANNLKMDLYINGPVVVSFEPDFAVMNYNSGIVDYGDDSFMKMNIKMSKNSASNNGKKPEWEKVDHSVVLTGWGKEVIDGKEIEYWKLQNSWGKGWGENGYFRMKAGVNLMSIESIGEAGIPLITEI